MPRLRATRLSAIASAARRLIDSSVFAGAAAAYSLRIPAGSNYDGPLVKVRRSDGNVQDIYASTRGYLVFDRWLDETALLNFVGSGSGFVTTFYDQTGNGRHAIQTTASFQPRIVNAGVLDTDNGRPTLRFLLASTTHLILPLLGVFDDSWSASAVIRTDPRASADWSDMLGTKTHLAGDGWFFRRGFSLAAGTLAANIGGNGASKSIQQLGDSPYPHREIINLTRAPSLMSLHSNNTLVGSDATITPSMQPSEAAAVRIGGLPGTRSHEGAISEVLIFPYALSDAQRSILTSNQSTAFGITVA